MTITRLPGSKWFIETDDVTFEIIGTYNLAAINADIVAINNTLKTLPSPSEDAVDIDWLLGKVTASTLTDIRKARITALVNNMYQVYQGDQRMVEVAQLINKRDALITLRERLV